MARLLLIFGVGFLAANLFGLLEQARYWRRRRTALLTWRGRLPPYFRMQVGIGVALGLLFLYNWLLRPGAAAQTFGVGMMFLYYAGTLPASTLIERGFYRDGIWSDRRFVRYTRIGAISWHDEAEPVLLVAARRGRTAARLAVPGHLLGAVRRLLRDLIGRHDIDLADTGLHLGLRDQRDDA
jgi:hypothetical protein